MTIGEVLEGRITELGISQAEAAQVLKVTQATVNRWINGVATPEISRAPALARFCEITERQAEAAINLQKKKADRGSDDVSELRREVENLRKEVARMARLILDRHDQG